LLGDLAQAQAAPGAEDALRADEREPILAHRRLELLERRAVGVQALEQLDPRLARGAVRAVEQAEGREVGSVRRHYAGVATRSAPLTGAASTGIPFSPALPDTASSSCSAPSALAFPPAYSAATRMRTPSPSWPQPCGIETTPGITSPVTSAASVTEPLRP